MIGKLFGVLDEISDEYIIINVGGVGYQVYATRRSYSNYNIGDDISLFIETHVREEYIKLYGFSNKDDRALFKLLCSVNGIGAKIALNILSNTEHNVICRAIIAKDLTVFTAISGIGKRVAERIVTELKDKVVQYSDISSQDVSLSVDSSLSNFSANKIDDGVMQLEKDAISALVNLGINRGDAIRRVNKILSKNSKIGIDELIRLTLNG